MFNVHFIVGSFSICVVVKLSFIKHEFLVSIERSINNNKSLSILSNNQVLITILLI